MLERMTQRTMRAIERADVAAIMRGWADDGVLEVAGHSTMSGRFQGRDAIESYFRRLFDGTRAITIEVRRVGLASLIGLTFANTAFVEYTLDEIRTDGARMHGHCIGVFQYRRGKVVSMREWWFDPTVLDAMWGRSSPERDASSPPAARAG